MILQKLRKKKLMKQENVMELIYEPGRLYEAWQRVYKNAGAAGVDKMSVYDFKQKEDKLLKFIHEKLKAGHWRFRPARRVLIPKPGTSKKRPLGIPVVMDRIVSQSIKMVFEEIFVSGFTASNFGFIKGKSQHQAVNHVQGYVKEGYDQAVSIDLKNFFGEIPHGLIFKLIRRKIADERVTTLIARALKAGVMIDGVFEKTPKGCPQGSPLSPMLSNIVLNELDQELEKRGLRYSRWADDFVIVVRSERAAHRVKGKVVKYLKEELELPVNEEKSQISGIDKVTYLGFQIRRGKKAISQKSRRRFKDKIRELTRRNNPYSMRQVIEKLNKYLRGWVGYYKVQEFKMILRDYDGWIRSRLRSMQLKKWKKPKKFQRMMIKAGFKVVEALKTWVRMKKWHSTHRKEVRFVMSREWFRGLGVIFLNDYTLVK